MAAKKRERGSRGGRAGRGEPAARERRAPAVRSERERGRSAFERGDYGGAIAAWTAAFRANPSEPLARALAEAHFRRACGSWRKSPAQALEDYRLAAELVPDDPRYLYHRGLMHHRQGHYKDAIRAYRECLRRDSRDLNRTAYALCLALAESGADPQEDSAWDLLNPTQRDALKPSDKAFLAAMTGLAHARFSAAEPFLNKLLKSHPGIAHYYLGVIAQRRGKPAEALAHWDAARAAGFNTMPLRYNLTLAYVAKAVSLADSPELTETLKTALRLAPDSPVLLKLKQRAEFLAGLHAANRGDWATALKFWLAAGKGHNNQPIPIPRELVSNIALAYEQLGRFAEAAEAWRDFARRRPRSGEHAWTAERGAELWKHIDSLYARAGWFEQSVTALRYAIKAQPDDVALRLALAKRHLENGNTRAAQAVVGRILEAAPAHAEARALYAQIIDTGSDLDAMIDAWEQVAIIPNPRWTHMARQRLAKLYTERGDFFESIDDTKSASADYAKALEITPDDPVLRARYGALLIHKTPSSALAQFEQVDLSNFAAAFTVIRAWHLAGNNIEASRWLARAEQHGAPLLIALGSALLDENETVANGYFLQAMEKAESGPDGPALLTAIGVVYARHGKINRAYDYGRRALALDPAYGPARFNMGLWDAARGRRQAAADHLQRALTWATDHKQRAFREGIEETINLIEERYIPTLDEILDTIDPDGIDADLRRLLGGGKAVS